MRHSSERRRRTPPPLDDPDGVLPPVIGDDAAASRPPASKEQRSKTPVAWKDMPQKRQLAILTLSRLSEPLVQTSLQASEQPLCPPAPLDRYKTIRCKMN